MDLIAILIICLRLSIGLAALVGFIIMWAIAGACADSAFAKHIDRGWSE